MSRHKNTTGYINPRKADVHSVGNTRTPLKKGTFVKSPKKLLYQYSNLIKKLGKQYSKNFSTYDQDEDLFAYIKGAFIELVIEYDPYSSVDFPGYIVKKLPLRIKYSYISKKFLHHSRMVLLHSGDYSMNDLLDLIQSHGSGQITTDKQNRVSRMQKVPRISFAFKERIKDICRHVKMDNLDRLIFVYLIDGFSKYSLIVKLAQKYEKRHSIKVYSSQVIRQHIKSLKKHLRNYYLQLPDSPVILKH